MKSKEFLQKFVVLEWIETMPFQEREISSKRNDSNIFWTILTMLALLLSAEMHSIHVGYCKNFSYSFFVFPF